MTPVFADASYYVALLSPRDQYHEAAVRISGGIHRRVVVTEFVLIEVSSALASLESRRQAIALWAHLQSDSSVLLVPASSELVAKGLDLYARRPDKEWSLIDCISFVVMDERGLGEALTSDRHFEQAGFRALLLSG